MTAALSPAPKLQFFASSGIPLVGGKLYSYAAGTSTPLATYADSGGVSTNTNPIILDSRGEAGVWLDSAAYKLVLKTATDVELWSVDNITSSEAAKAAAEAYAAGLVGTLISDLANTATVAKGDALIGFRQAGASGILPNAVASTVHNKLRELVSVKDFGAVGDGTTDDTTAIQNAVNALGVQGIYGHLYFPAGTYKITSTITVPYPIYLTGAGVGSGGYPTGPQPTKLLWAGTASTMMIFGLVNEEPFCGGGISDMSFDGAQVAKVCLELINCIHGAFYNLGLFHAVEKCLFITNSPGVVYPTGLHTFSNLNVQTGVTGFNTAAGIFVDGDTTGGQTVAGVTLCSFENTIVWSDQGPGIYIGNRGDNFSWRRLNVGGQNFLTAPSIWYGATDPTVAIVDGGTFVDVAANCGLRFDGAGTVFATKFFNLDEVDISDPLLSNPNTFVSGPGAPEVTIVGSTGTVWGPQALNGPRNTFFSDGMQFIRWDSANNVLHTLSGNWRSFINGTGGVTDGNQLGGAVSVVSSATAGHYAALSNSVAIGQDGIALEYHPTVFFTVYPDSETDIVCRWGWMDSLSNPPANGIYVEYDPSVSSKLQFVCRKGGVGISSMSAYDAVAAVRNIRISLSSNPPCAIFAAREYPNALFETPIVETTHIPTFATPLSFCMQVISKSASAKSMMVYDVKMSQLTEEA